jgi:general stress protein YciG
MAEKKGSSGNKSNRGMAGMDSSKQKKIASEGGKASQSARGAGSGGNSGGSATQSKSNSSSKKGVRGFAAMSTEQRRAIASMGGKAAHQKGTAHQWTPQEAAEAGRKGGQASHGGGRKRSDEN